MYSLEYIIQLETRKAKLETHVNVGLTPEARMAGVVVVVSLLVFLAAGPALPFTQRLLFL